jgi:hypothetical protein
MPNRLSTRPRSAAALPPPFLLPNEPSVPASLRGTLEADFEQFRSGLPADLRAHCVDQYGIDVGGIYAGRPTRNPFGKASGQLSLNARQVRRDAEAGLGFVVLKTVIAEDEQGDQSMAAWAIRETHMRVDRIAGEDGTPGWTVTWKGRGWHESFESYRAFFAEAVEAACEVGMPVAPSVKYHLPAPGEGAFREGEYRYTTRRLQEVWLRTHPGEPMPLEKDFSPTLAGDDRSRELEQILVWLRDVPALIAGAADEPGVCLGVKLMNARFGLEFQEAMFRTLVDEASRPPEFVVYANRLFDAQKSFEDTVGVAYGGPDLSRRNLEALNRIIEAQQAGRIRRRPVISGTGDILTGKMAVEYGLRGATSCQMHTLFQLPDTEFAATARNKTEAVLHHLIFHPQNGLIAWLLHLQSVAGRPLHWRDLPVWGCRAS